MLVSRVVEQDHLILAAQTGDPAAIAQLLAVCQADARRYARKHCQILDVALTALATAPRSVHVPDGIRKP